MSCIHILEEKKTVKQKLKKKLLKKKIIIRLFIPRFLVDKILFLLFKNVFTGFFFRYAINNRQDFLS